MLRTRPHIVVIGAGIGGLCTALRLAHAGAQITVVEQNSSMGGKMRTMPSIAGPVDAGPTVLTMKHVFEDLFISVGERLDEHVTLTREDMLARHFWADGTTLDLMANPAQSRANVADAFGSNAAKQLDRFTNRTAKLFAAFDAPIMQSPTPDIGAMMTKVLRNPQLILDIAPHQSLTKALKYAFDEPRLGQLFARYATYVGGLPENSPALLSLIAHAEAQGVWHVTGGMHLLAKAIADLATSFGATFHYDTTVTRIETANGRVAAVHHETGRISADTVVFNGDPNALPKHLLGPDVAKSTPTQTPRSLSAYVHTFASTPTGLPLAAHNVLFADDPLNEYAPLRTGNIQTDPTLYICAQDRFSNSTPVGPERFEIILNAPPTSSGIARHATERKASCLTLIENKLHRFGLTFTPMPTMDSLTTPQNFSQMFPASHGSLYGRSPHGIMATFKRPTAQTKTEGLYLTGGGAHPGAGVPMAALSGAHAAAAIIKNLSLI
jgi:1-hydroxycarotenoid 3,4-desaturase